MYLGILAEPYSTPPILPHNYSAPILIVPIECLRTYQQGHLLAHNFGKMYIIFTRCWWETTAVACQNISPAIARGYLITPLNISRPCFKQ